MSTSTPLEDMSSAIHSACYDQLPRPKGRGFTRISINASEVELCKVKGIGPSVAKRIIEAVKGM